MRKFVIILSMLLLPQICFSADQSKFEELSFEAKLSNVRLNYDFIKQGKKLTDSVQTSAKGILFDPPIKVSFSEPWGHNRAEPIEAITNYHRALAQAEGKDLLPFWHPDSIEGVKQSLEETPHDEKYRSYFRSLQSISILCIIEAASSKVVFINWGNMVQSYEMKYLNGEWLQSNVPTDDLKFAIIEGALSH